MRSKTWRGTRRWATRRSACRAAFRGSRPLTASRRDRDATSLPSADCHRSTSGPPSFICVTFPSCLRGCARAFGEELHLLHDCHHRLTPIEAGRLGKELEPFHLFWMEDPTPAELQEGFKIIREHTTTPIAVGEVFNSIWDAHDLIRNQWIDYLRMTLVHGGGFTHLKKVADFAELYHVRTGFHGATDLSPVTMAAALHFDTAIHNFGIQEHMPHTDETDAVFPHHYTFKDGMMYPGRRARTGRGPRREASGEVSLSARLSAHQSQAGRNIDRLVTANAASERRQSQPLHLALEMIPLLFSFLAQASARLRLSIASSISRVFLKPTVAQSIPACWNAKRIAAWRSSWRVKVPSPTSFMLMTPMPSLFTC